MLVSDRQAFENALKANPLCEVSRGAFADWLDEHDEPEEADRQRKWIPSYHWVKDFSDQLDPGYEGLMEAARTWVASSVGSYPDYTYDNTESYKDIRNYDDWKTFWGHYYILTGERPEPDRHGDNLDCPFTCSC